MLLQVISTFFLFSSILIYLALVNVMDYGSSQERTVSWSCLTMSHSITIGAIVDPGGPACPPLMHIGHHQCVRQQNSVSSPTTTPTTTIPTLVEDGLLLATRLHFHSLLAAAATVVVVVQVVDLEVEQKMLISCWLAVSSDEKLLRKLNEFDVSETVLVSGKGTDEK